MRVKLVDYTRDGERIVAAAAKQTIKGRSVNPDSLSDSEVEDWIRELIKRQYFSPFEFSHYTFRIDGCSRICTHQLVRHRMASYMQQSMRRTEAYLRKLVLTVCGTLGVECPGKPRGRTDYLRYASALKAFIDKYCDGRPHEWELIVSSTASIAFVMASLENAGFVACEYLRSVVAYYTLLYNNVSMENARYVLPGAVKTTIYVSMNARELLQVFFPLRLCAHAQWEIRRIAWYMLFQLRNVHPRIFNYAGPRCLMQENALREQPITLEEILNHGEGIELLQSRCPEGVPKNHIIKCLTRALTKF